VAVALAIMLRQHRQSIVHMTSESFELMDGYHQHLNESLCCYDDSSICSPLDASWNHSTRNLDVELTSLNNNQRSPLQCLVQPPGDCIPPTEEQAQLQVRLLRMVIEAGANVNHQNDVCNPSTMS